MRDEHCRRYAPAPGSARIDLIEPEARAVEPEAHRVEKVSFFDEFHAEQALNLKAAVAIGLRGQPMLSLLPAEHGRQRWEQIEVAAAFGQLRGSFQHRGQVG